MPFRLFQPLVERQAARADLPEGVSRTEVSADGVRCDWLTPHGSAPERVLLYLHGDGFVMGASAMHVEMAARLAQGLGARALLVHYRLAPQHPYPAALDDCLTAYHWLLKQRIQAGNIVVAGDSAGGNLTLTLLMALRDRGEPLPAAGACLSPVADLAAGLERFETQHDAVLHPRAARGFNRAYVAEHDPHDPLISPVCGDWAGLPPLLIHAGEEEVLREDAEQVGALARVAGVDVRVEIYPRMWHVWQIHHALPETAQSLADITQFFASHLGVPQPATIS